MLKCARCWGSQIGCALSFQPHHCHSRLQAGISLEIGAARLLSPLFGYAEWLEPYGLHARVQRKIRHSFSLRSNIGGFCRTDFVSSSGTPPNTQRATPTGRLFVYRGSQIRTDDILLPKQTLYQAELHPECDKYSKIFCI